MLIYINNKTKSLKNFRPLPHYDESFYKTFNVYLNIKENTTHKISLIIIYKSLKNQRINIFRFECIQTAVCTT